jgi:drug/metabolite transporter (DMT)-like permease
VHRLRILAAFAVVYVVWGSTYAAIRIGVSALPPAALSGGRFVIAGLLMLAFALWRGHRIPTGAAAWRMLLILGVTMVVLSNGLVTWAEQYVPSNQAALIGASSALWTAWLGTFGARAHPLSARSKLGLGAGFAGVGLLLWPAEGPAGAPVFAQLVLLLAAFSWSAGGIYARNHPLELPTIMLAALQMLVGGSIMLAVSLAAGEVGRITWNATGIATLAYLAIVGSCLAYATYFWLIRNTTPDRLGTIAYVNPAIATVLGWLLLDEALSGTQITGMVIILAGVLLVVWQRRVSR